MGVRSIGDQCSKIRANVSEKKLLEKVLDKEAGANYFQTVAWHPGGCD
jgi:hypothetical protein